MSTVFVGDFADVVDVDAADAIDRNGLGVVVGVVVVA